MLVNLAAAVRLSHSTWDVSEPVAPRRNDKEALQPTLDNSRRVRRQRRQAVVVTAGEIGRRGDAVVPKNCDMA